MKATTITSKAVLADQMTKTTTENNNQALIAFACVSFFPAMYFIGKLLMSL